MVFVLIDQYPILRRGLISFLSDRFENVAALELERIRPVSEDFQGNIDLVIMSIDQSVESEYQYDIDYARKLWPGAALIVYDGEMDSGIALECFRLGVSAYITKDCGLVSLSECIRTVLSGKKYVDEKILSTALFAEGYKLGISKGGNELTANEYEVAKYLSEGKGTSWIAQVTKRKPSTISTIKLHIFQKLGVDNIVKLRDRITRVRIKPSKRYA